MCAATSECTTLPLPALITWWETVEREVQWWAERKDVCVCEEEGREVIRCQFLDFFYTPPPPPSGLHLRKWILQSAYSAPKDETNTWDVKAGIVWKPNFCFKLTVSLKKRRKKKSLQSFHPRLRRSPVSANVSDLVIRRQLHRRRKTWLACTYSTASTGASTGVRLERAKQGRQTRAGKISFSMLWLCRKPNHSPGHVLPSWNGGVKC